jgi:stage II sporulation protein P
VADDSYPGLIKDIFIGKGSYNQELSPRSLLFEMGTHENTKEAAQKSTAYLADVVSRSLFGGRTEDQAGDKKDKDAEETRKDEKREDGRRTGISRINRETGQDNDAGGGRGLTWLLVVVVAGVVGFLLISMGGKELSSKFRGSSRQEYSSFPWAARKRRSNRGRLREEFGANYLLQLLGHLCGLYHGSAAYRDLSGAWNASG